MDKQKNKTEWIVRLNRWTTQIFNTETEAMHIFKGSNRYRINGLILPHETLHRKILKGRFFLDKILGTKAEVYEQFVPIRSKFEIMDI